MKKFVVIAFLTLLCHAPAAETIKLMTFNLRFASEQRPNSWPERRPVKKECINEAAPDIIGTQEGVYHQLKDIAADAPHYEWIGLGRDGGSKGEFMAIFFRKDRFEPLEYDHFWLSDTPDVIASSTWGNSNRRMVTWVRFQIKGSSQQFYLFNTHFDHQIQPAREKSARLLRERIGALKTELPVILLGDFNAKAEANPAYAILTEGDFLRDTWKTAKERRGRIVATFHGFRGPREEDNRIDWILSRGGVTALWTEILTCSRNGQFPSDHFPVVVSVEL